MSADGRATVAAALLSCILVPMEPARAQTLDEVLTAAYRNSPQLASARDQLRAVNERVPQALAATRPTATFNGTRGDVHERSNGPVEPSSVSGSLDQGYFPTDLPRSSYGVTVTQPIYRGGQTLAQFRSARSQVASERARVGQTEGEILLRAATDYADLAQAEEALTLSRRRVDTTTSDVRQAQGRYDGGALTRTDLAQSEAARADAMGQQAQAALAVDRARAALERDTTVSVVHADLPMTSHAGLPASREEAVRMAQDASPAVQVARFAADAARQQVRVAQGQALPSLSVQGTLEHQEGTSFRGEQDDIKAVILQLRVPIYSGGALASQTRAARATADERLHDLDQARSTAADAADEAWAQLQSAEAAVAAYSTQASINEVAAVGVRLEASTGERTVQDVLVAELALFQSRLRLLQARHDSFVSRFAVTAAAGTLDARSLNLPPPYFNPEVEYRKVRLGPGR